jgi:hypothetical protein
VRPVRFDIDVQTSNWRFPWFWLPRVFAQTDWRAHYVAAMGGKLHPAASLEFAFRVGFSMVTVKVWRA